MRKFGIAIALGCALSMCLAFTGCNGASEVEGGSGSGETAAALEVFAGTWELAGMVNDGSEIGADEIEMLSKLGYEVYMNLHEDGVAELVLFGRSAQGSWEADSEYSGTINLLDDVVDMRIQDGELSMAQGDTSLSFVKGEPRSGESADSAGPNDGEASSSSASPTAAASTGPAASSSSSTSTSPATSTASA